MTEHNHHRTTAEESHKHCARPSRLQHTVSLILEVVTADFVVNIGVLATGTVVMMVELGVLHPGEGHVPQEPVRVVTVVPSPTSEAQH